jgi:hypothetical protein
MSAKIAAALVIALSLAAGSFAFASKASAYPRSGRSYGEQNWMDRASNGGHHTGDTNGF